MPISPDTPKALTADQAAIIELVAPLIDACPDILQMARETAQAILKKHGVPDLEPDAVYWHRFSNTQSSERSFSGWEHIGPPTQTLSLPQLVIQRFGAGDQLGTDDLDQMSGFYTVDDQASHFDAFSEVPLRPSDVLIDFWALEFSSMYLKKLNAFWLQRSDDFRTLAKANFLSSALNENAAKRLSDQDVKLLADAVGVDITQPMTLHTLQTKAPVPDHVQVCTFDVVGYQASDILRFVLPKGRQILYIPARSQCFHVFETAKDLHWWLCMQTDQKENRASFITLFSQSDNGSGKNLHDALDQLFTSWGEDASAIINHLSAPLSIDAFDLLRDSTRSRMLAEANSALGSNNELRKQIWLGYLGAVNNVAGPLGALCWPVALAALGAGIAQTGMNIDQAVNGRTTALREAGVKGAIVGAVMTLFNLPVLFHGAGTSPASDIAQAAEAKTQPATAQIDALPSAEATPKVVVPDPDQALTLPPDQVLATYQTNQLLDGYTPEQGPGKMQGIYVLEDGSTYICINGYAYAVRYMQALRSWAIVDAENLFSFYRNLPVRRTDDGTWITAPKAGLPGGGGALGRVRPESPRCQPPLREPFTSPYEVPRRFRNSLRLVAEDPRNELDNVFYAASNEDPANIFKRLRANLLKDARAFYADPPQPPRPSLPQVNELTGEAQFLDAAYARSEGLVLGEEHSNSAGKWLLIRYMRHLAKLKVKTIYMEHLLTDFHQNDLDALFQTNTIRPEIEGYLDRLDAGHLVPTKYGNTFRNVVIAARNNGIHVQAIDCMASYRLSEVFDADGTVRQQMMNFYAHTVIQANQARIGGGRWVAFVGNSHANTFKGVPGLAELEGAIGLRVEDVPPGSASGFDKDPGLVVVQDPAETPVTVKSDFRLRVIGGGPQAHDPVR